MVKKISHIILAFLLVIAVPGLMLNFHYCQEEIYDIAFYTEAEDCCSDDNARLCEREKQQDHCDVHTEQQNHCEDETVIIEHIDDFIVTSFNVSHFSPVNIFFSIPVITDHTNISKNLIQHIPERDISPPKIQTILSLLQTYLL